MSDVSDHNDHEVAARLATDAGRLLLAVRDELADATEAERKAAGDKRSHDYLMDALARERPDDAVLSEEGVDDPVRLRAQRVWIVDPLDGTREFSELGRKDWAVHVALWQSGELVAGAVALPAQGVTLATPDPAPPPDATEAPRIVVSRTRPPAIALQVRDQLNGTLVEMGSAGAKVAAVIQGSGRRVRPRRRTVRVGFGGTGRGGPRRRSAHLAHRRFAAGVQPARPTVARPGGVPTRIRRRGARGHGLTGPGFNLAVGESYSMRMSAKAEYAVRAMVELATVGDGVRVTTDDLAKAQGIPPQFLVDILSDLRNDRLVRSHRGRDGGYELARPGNEISIADVLRCIDGPLASVRDVGLGDLPVFRSDRGADRRVAGAAGQHALGAGGNEPG